MRPSVLLIFGTSHVGKSSLAGRLGEVLGWRVASTDKMGRHPGRPWPEVRDPVAEYYSSLTDETIYWFLRVHHENLWPFVRQRIHAECDANRGWVLEGSALRPEFIADLGRQEVQAVGLYAEPDFLRRRMEAESRYAQQDDVRKLLIDKFIARSLRDNDQVVEDANRLGLRLVNAADAEAVERLSVELIGAALDR